MNPFRDTVVRDPWGPPSSDVLTIHQQAFERCLAGLQSVRVQKQSGSILIHGPAGGGKTHLLRRLRAHLSLQLPSATDREEALFVWVRLQTTPRMIWRTLRRTLVNDWFRPLDGQSSQFDRILYHQLARIRVAEGDLDSWHKYMLDEDPAGLEVLIDRIAESLDLDRNTAVALQHLTFGRHRRDLRAWLAGDALPEAALQRIELTQEDGTDEELEDVARKAVIMLCRLAGNELPIVLSFDQVEALETTVGNREALFSFGQLISTLHDSTSNLLLISAVQSSFADRLLKDSREADRDRMGSLDTLTLNALNREEGAALIRARLEGQRGVKPSDQVPLWPLNQNDVTELFGLTSVTPRKLLARCADRFEEWQFSTTAGTQQVPTTAIEGTSHQTEAVASQRSPTPLAEYLCETWERSLSLKLADNEPHQSEEIIRGIVPVLARLNSSSTKVVVDEQLPDVSLIMQSEQGRIGVAVCAQPHMTSLAAKLKRLRSQQRLERLSRFVLIRDSRVPLTPTAKKARDHLKDLEDHGAVVLHPSKEVLATLDALRGLLADAQAGDLSCHGETIVPQTLEEWLVQNLPDDLQDFMDSVLGTYGASTESDSRVLEGLTSLLVQEPLLPLVQAANRLGITPTVLAEVIQRHRELFGLIEQPESVVFRVVAGAAAI